MYTQWQCILSYDNSNAMYNFLKTLHPGSIRTRDLLFGRRTRWLLCHAVRASLLVIGEIRPGYLITKTSVIYVHLKCSQQTYVHISFTQQNLPSDWVPVNLVRKMLSCSISVRVLDSLLLFLQMLALKTPREGTLCSWAKLVICNCKLVKLSWLWVIWSYEYKCKIQINTKKIFRENRPIRSPCLNTYNTDR
jgi:hypothetical protein